MVAKLNFLNYSFSYSSSSSKIIDGSKTFSRELLRLFLSSSSKIIDGSKTGTNKCCCGDRSSSSKIIDGSKTWASSTNGTPSVIF